MRPTPTLAVIVATRNRPELLGGLLIALAEQGREVDRVVVVDSSDQPDASEQAVTTHWPTGSTFVRSDRASTPYQRNLGVEHLVRTDELADYVAFLDDDVRPADDYLRRLVDLLERDVECSIAGACGVTDDQPPEPPLRYRLYAGFFRLWSRRQGSLLRSGVNVAIHPSSGSARRSAWLIGCSVWRGDVFGTHRFNGAMPGGALFEDVEFSGRVGRSRTLVVDPGAHLHHLYAAEGRAEEELQSFRWIRNRYEVVCTVHRTRIPKLVFWWSTVGEILLLTAKCAYNRDKHWKALRGALRGAVASLRGDPMI